MIKIKQAVNDGNNEYTPGQEVQLEAQVEQELIESGAAEAVQSVDMVESVPELTRQDGQSEQLTESSVLPGVELIEKKRGRRNVVSSTEQPTE